jgi:hypothetical protein
MASSYNTIGLELMGTGENAGTWGDKTNDNLNLIEQAIAGYEAVTITDSTTTTLVMSNAALSNARNMIIKIATITLTGATTVTIPDGIEKFYIFDLTAVTGVTNLTIKTASGTGFTAGEAKIVAAYSDGTNLNEIALDTLGGTIGSAQIADNAIISAKISANQVTTAKIADNAITTAKISALQVTADKIANSTITQAKLASNSVGSDQLISTGVTAAAYTTANITVDADGRITAASSGAGGDGGYVFADGSLAENNCQLCANATYTANPAATGVLVYAIGGGGGGGYTQPGADGSWGGNGGFGVYKSSITHPYTQCFTVGCGGPGGSSPGPSIHGLPGGSTIFGPSPTPLLVASGGPGGCYNRPAIRYEQTGSVPTCTYDLSITLPSAFLCCPSQSATDAYSTRRINSFYGGGFVPNANSTGVGKGGQICPAASPNVPGNGKSGGPGIIAIYELLP